MKRLEDTIAELQAEKSRQVNENKEMKFHYELAIKRLKDEV